jgi:hypothetical protein
MNNESWNLSLIGVAILIVIIIFGAFYNANKINTLINECEKDLPRTQHCHLIGVPDNK